MNTPTQPWDITRALYDNHLQATFDSFTHPGHVGVEWQELQTFGAAVEPANQDEALDLIYGGVQ